ncbi:hypothetical protein LVB87_15555 [Lysobacter sp. KIS68-7]|uniref:hypothetical protein n=1 Tax=Lysobacter sp. KIS68-7 TaxID=2904252 RepID=UPI001E3A0634|nr:hypothetical protein [Lysobacter sp. KIS68-7]UHQ19582.1 hypothetical protein LVB87_15555 [Lysobacter sp. KIS68-7]
MQLDEDLAFDEAHPIPNLEVIDVWTVLKTGGSDMHIIIASPLHEDRRSLERLMCKLERYLAYLRTAECIEKCGEATAENTQIIVKIHPDSSPVAFELLDRNRIWVRNNDATLVIETHGIVE